MSDVEHVELPVAQDSSTGLVARFQGRWMRRPLSILEANAPTCKRPPCFV